MQSSFSNLSVTSPTSQLILQPFHHFTYVTAHSSTLLSHLLHHRLILQCFRCFNYVTAHSPTLLLLLLHHRIFTYVTWPSLHLRHSSFSNPSVALPTSQLILQLFRCFDYVTAHSPTLLSLLLHHRFFTYVTCPSLHLRHSSFSNPSVALLTSQLILQSFRRFTYVTAHSPNLPSLYLRHSSFSNPSFAPTASQALHLRHLASRPCVVHELRILYNYVTRRQVFFNKTILLCMSTFICCCA